MTDLVFRGSRNKVGEQMGEQIVVLLLLYLCFIRVIGHHSMAASSTMTPDKGR